MLELTEQDREIYGWQLPVTGFGEEGQRRLKNATVLVSRCGGLGGVVAHELAAAGVGHLILAHAGNLRPDDLNRQLLMTRDWVGKPRIESVARRLREFNPDILITAVPENISEANVASLVARANLVVDCAPLFEERYLLNREVVRQHKTMVECAVYELEIHLTSIIPGETPCLRCLYPEKSGSWTRRFPIFGAVSGAAGGLAAMEAIKHLAGLDGTLRGEMLACDLGGMTFRKLKTRRNPHCEECGTVEPIAHPRPT